MSNGKVWGASAALLAAGGIAAAVLTGGPATDVGNGAKNGASQIITATNIEEHQACPRAFRAANGRRIRVVGVEGESTTVQDTELGRVVDIEAIPAAAICPVIIHADAMAVDAKMWPDVNGIEWGMRPVPLGHSKRGNNYVWHSYVLGQDACEAAVSHPNYIGSSIAELLTLEDEELKSRCLVTTGACNVDGQITECNVPFGDSRTIAGKKIRFPHRLAGRPDINLVHADSKGTPEDRVPEPDGGWGAEIPEPDGGIGQVDGGKPDAEVSEIP